jgi:hypothetical protein
LLAELGFRQGQARTHLSLEKDAPVSRAVDRAGHILCRPTLCGLHHHMPGFDLRQAQVPGCLDARLYSNLNRRKTLLKLCRARRAGNGDAA